MNEEAYVAYHGWVYLKNAINSHQYGLRVLLKLCHEDDLKVFEGLQKHRKNRAGSGAFRVMTRLSGREDWYGPVDMLFITWSHSVTGGAVITFELDDQQEWEAIRARPALMGGTDEAALDKIEMMMIELDDEGKVVDVKQRAKLEAMARKRKWPKGGPQSKRAARLCQDPEFKLWLGHRMDWQEVDTAKAADWMRRECDLDTRAQLDHDPAALQRFEDRVAKPFLRTQL